MSKPWAIVVFLIATSCHQNAVKEKASLPKGELAFLLQYNNRLPSEVGFLTNHVVERRIANLLKNDFESFVASTKFETPLKVNTENNCVYAAYYEDTLHHMISAEIIIDVTNDAVWLAWQQGSYKLKKADYNGLPKPKF